MRDFAPGTGTQFGSIESLAKRLGLRTEKLIHIAENVDSYWIKGKTLVKPDGSKRETHNAKPELKGIHQSIKEKILLPTYFPEFLHGALPKRSVFSNAANHTHKRVLISEDIANFFPNTSEVKINTLWKRFYNCPPEVANTLTKLTTHKGMLPQGWKTSSYLANLVFWDSELELYLKLQRRGFKYSRFVDDVSVSAHRNYTPRELTQVISEINGLFSSKGYRLKRTKHQVKTSSSRQQVNNQVVNSLKVSMPVEYRKIIRAKVHRLKTDHLCGASSCLSYAPKWKKLCAQVGKLKRGHIEQYTALRKTLDKIKPQ